jgi:hypothetical protein
VSCKNFLEGLVGDSNPCVGNTGKSKLRVVMEAHADLSSLTVIFDGIGEKIIEELVEFVLDSGDLYLLGRELSFQLDLMFLSQGFDGSA